MAKFILEFNGSLLREIPIEKGIITIGREKDNDIAIENLAVSRYHTRLIQKEDKFVLEDLASSNGTFVNKRKIDRYELKEEDVILIGKHTLIFKKENEGSVSIPKPHFEERTGILDTRKHRELLAKNLQQRAEKRNEIVALKGIIAYISDSGKIKEVQLNKKVTTIGKGNTADVKVKGFLVGKSALLIDKKPDGFYVSRGNGINSPRLNGKSIRGKNRLMNDDFIDIGTTKMHFSIKGF